VLLGRVIGQVVPAVAYEGLAGVPMLFVQPLDKQGEPKGAPLVAADSTRMAGPGELVYYEGGREAALALDPWFVPIDHTIVGIVDALNTGTGDQGPGTGSERIPNPESRIPGAKP
jgi:ethanolamine utilization protein EutN